ncbi:MAG: hypothetical protein KDC14_16735 [Planctomycetes bacterium]|nr:hypothetical protein [Planctomycetota bacterium]
MFPAALRALLVLFAALGALSAPRASASCAGVAESQSAQTARPLDRTGFVRDAGWNELAVSAKPASDAPVGAEDQDDTECVADGRPAGNLRPSVRKQALVPLRRSALAPGERPASLAYLRLNGHAHANGVGT